MQYKHRQGRKFTSVPDYFAIAFWGSLDGGITHGDAYQVTTKYPKLYKDFKEASEKFGQKMLGKAAKWAKNDKGQVHFILVDSLSYARVGDPQLRMEALEHMRDQLLKTDIRKISMPYPPNFSGNFEQMVRDVFADTDFAILVNSL